MTNSFLAIRGNCDHAKLAGLLTETRWSEETPNPATILFPVDCFIDASAIALLASWGMAQRAKGLSIRFQGNPNTLNYLSRMDVFRHVGFEFDEYFQRHEESGRFLPALSVIDDESVAAATDAICELVLSQFDNARELLPALEWCVGEIIDNVRVHAEVTTPGVVCAQYYPAKNRIDLAIVDTGRGIKASLSERFDLWSHGDAVTKALQRGVTRNQAIGQGNGLAGTLEIVRKNKGELRLWTGDICFRSHNGSDGKFNEVSPLPGTGVFVRLDTTNPVRLEETFIGEPAWTYLDYQAEHIVESGGIRVAAVCVHTRGRAPARFLRRKIEALLPDLDGPLILDFDGIASASSSFLDELLGRLAELLGASRFGQVVRVINAPPVILAMANVVIGQRLEGLPNQG